ncbi:MAG: protein kinase [Candidatus Woesearchaeota archaeon]|jgi:serine/threonine protein kinase
MTDIPTGKLNQEDLDLPTLAGEAISQNQDTLDELTLRAYFQKYCEMAGYIIPEKSLVGIAGEAIVYRAEEGDRNPHAIKLLRTLTSLEEIPETHALSLEARYTQMAKEAGAFVPRIYDHGTIRGTDILENAMYLDMEFIEGDVAARLHLTPKEAVKVSRDTAFNLSKFHTLGFPHGDLKRANILVPYGRHAYLIDTTPQREEDRVDKISVLYCPEEVLTKKIRPNEAADMYALGITLYWLVKNRRPFQNELRPKTESELQQAVRVQLYTLKELRRGTDYLHLPPLKIGAVDLTDIFRECTHKDPSKRLSAQTAYEQLNIAYDRILF